MPIRGVCKSNGPYTQNGTGLKCKGLAFVLFESSQMTSILNRPARLFL